MCLLDALWSIWTPQARQVLLQNKVQDRKWVLKAWNLSNWQGHRNVLTTLSKKYYSGFVLQDHKNSFMFAIIIWSRDAHTVVSLHGGSVCVDLGKHSCCSVSRSQLIATRNKTTKMHLQLPEGAQQCCTPSRRQAQWSRIRAECKQEDDNNNISNISTLKHLRLFVVLFLYLIHKHAQL